MSLIFKIADGCAPTGVILRGLVGAGHATSAGVVCWGRGHNGTEPALNARAGSADKLQQLRKFKDAGILTPPFWEKVPTAPGDFPVLGRLKSHKGGTDIALIMEPAMAELFPRDFYTRYIPKATEFRTWIYRRRHLATYEKRRKPNATSKQLAKIGSNYRNGWAFQLVPSEGIPDGLRDIASKAVDALGLDFGAVDVLRGTDNALYVLEVNTAPGVEGESRAGIQALAAKIRKWESLKFPRRNGENANPTQNHF